MTRDSLRILIEQNVRLMRSINPKLSLFAKLKAENDEAWKKIAKIDAEERKLQTVGT